MGFIKQAFIVIYDFTEKLHTRYITEDIKTINRKSRIKQDTHKLKLTEQPPELFVPGALIALDR